MSPKKSSNTTILTYHVKHNRNFDNEFKKAKLIAEYAIKNKDNKKVLTSKYVKEIGMKSAISNQILRKYSNETIKEAKNVNLIFPNQSIGYDEDMIMVKLKPLGICFRWCCGRPFEKINQIEVDKEKFMISVTFNNSEQGSLEKDNLLALDLNCGYDRHIINAADMKNNKVLNLGKKGPHLRYKYFELRRRFQKNKNKSALNQINDKEKRIMRDLDHKLSRKIVDYANDKNLQIIMENLTNIRKSKRSGNGSSKKVNRIVNSWSFYRLQSFIEYKAKLLGIPVVYVPPHYTSQTCSHCKKIGKRSGKWFQCNQKKCKKRMNSDVNAAYCVGKRYQGIL